MEWKLPPHLKSVATLPCDTTLWKVSGQLYRFTEQLIQRCRQSDEKCLIAVSVHKGCYVFVYNDQFTLYV